MWDAVAGVARNPPTMREAVFSSSGIGSTVGQAAIGNNGSLVDSRLGSGLNGTSLGDGDGIGIDDGVGIGTSDWAFAYWNVVNSTRAARIIRSFIVL